MTREEFARVVAYLTAATDRELALDRLEVYFDLLGDLSYETLLTAAKRVALEHRYATFPSVAELRAAAVATARGEVAALSPAQAWELAWRVVRNTDPEIEGSFQRATRGVPPLVVEAIMAYGLQSLCYGAEPVGVVRGQFLKIFEQLASRCSREALLSTAIRREIEAIGRRPKESPPLLGDVLRGIGSDATE